MAIPPRVIAALCQAIFLMEQMSEEGVPELQRLEDRRACRSRAVCISSGATQPGATSC